ncbi:Undefined function [Listeria monocytogenes]|nr:Undefined function [Listeria monocytogenes]
MTPKMETPSLSWQSFIAEEQQEDEAGYKPLRETIQKQMKEAYGLQTNKFSLHRVHNKRSF